MGRCELRKAKHAVVLGTPNVGKMVTEAEPSHGYARDEAIGHHRQVKDGAATDDSRAAQQTSNNGSAGTLPRPTEGKNFEKSNLDFATIALSLFAQPSALLTILLGALGGMLPDAFQFVHRLYPREPLRTVQRFHSWIHAKQKLDWPVGIASQLAFNVAVILLAVELQM